MPRPGPRPYECVRRPWHSDRHQPMRGSLIQEIFRVANEIHSPATKKNKKWQEKLPIVVLKAEEIMYSKANSEAEFMDLKTLWNRMNDAIDTIIRRDESTETGEYLQPCIEAALILGCIPRRASRSQQHSNPRYYLNPSAQETTSAAVPRVPNSAAHEGSLSDQSGQLSFQVHDQKNMVVGIPCVHSTAEPAGMPVLENLFACGAAVNASDRDTESWFKKTYKRPSGIECDLSLRLGTLPVADSRAENEWQHKVEAVFDSSYSRDGCKSNSQSPPMGLELCFLPKSDHPLKSCSVKWSSEVESVNVEVKKQRSAPVSDFTNAGNICKQS